VSKSTFLGFALRLGPFHGICSWKGLFYVYTERMAGTVGSLSLIFRFEMTKINDQNLKNQNGGISL
jgi:hypothetical protein